MNRIHYLTLEFILDDKTYWLTSGTYVKHQFTEIPLSFFDGLKLKTGLVFNAYASEEDSRCSSIEIFEDGSAKFADESGNSLNLNTPPELNRVLSWNEMANLISSKQPESLSLLYFNNIVKKSDNCKYEINDVEYKVTAFLPEHGVISIIGQDYKVPENPNWITFNGLDDEKSFVDCAFQFKVEAVRIGDSYYEVD